MRFPLPLSDVVRSELTSIGLAERLKEAEIWSLWPEVVGQTVAARAIPLRIIKGSLTVAVSSGPWKQELNFLKGMMIEKLNERLGGEVVREIILRSGQIDRNDVLAPEPPEDAPRKKRLTARQLSFIDEQSVEIADPEIREAFVALMKASFEHKRQA
jgi:hypothetical protein